MPLSDLHLNSHQTEAIAVADAHLTNCGLPSYTTLLTHLSSVEGLADFLSEVSADLLKTNHSAYSSTLGLINDVSWRTDLTPHFRDTLLGHERTE